LKDTPNSTSLSKKVMIVDDDEDILELIKATLELEGYETIVAHDGDECLKLLKKTKPELILLDLMMPDMDGREVCRKIRNNPDYHSIKIAFVTVVKSDDSGQEFIRLMNVSDYIEKPFTIDDFVGRVRKIIGKAEK
jgi:DNA-binding response OmpR family regulator